MQNEFQKITKKLDDILALANSVASPKLIQELNTFAKDIENLVTIHKSADIQNFRNHYLSMPAPAYTWQKSGDTLILVDYNQDAEKITKGKVKDQLGRTLENLYKNRPDIIQDFEKCLAGKTKVERDIEFQDHTTGKTTFLNTKYTYIPENIIIVHTEDITERKTKELAIRRSEEKFRSIIAQSVDGIVLTGEDGKIIEWNKAQESLSGICREDAIGQYAWDLQFSIMPEQKRTTENYNHLKSLTINLINTKSATIFPPPHTVTIEVNGKTRILSNLIFPITFSGGTIIGAITRDVTEQIRAQQELEQSKNELVELVESKDKFFSIIVHDLKNPFNNLLNLSGMLKNQFDSFETTEIKDFIDVIFMTTRKAWHLLDNLLIWEQLQLDKITPKPTLLSTHDILADLQNEFSEEINTKEIDFQIETKHTIKIFVDYNIITIILRNLISNALKFTPKKGKVSIGITDKDELAWFSIKDNGIGISMEELQKLFKLDEGFSRKGTQGEEGSGFGLILCKEFVKLYGGEIFAKSEFGEGSQFKFSVPLFNPEKHSLVPQ